MSDSLNDLMAELLASGCTVTPPEGDADFVFQWVVNGKPVRFTYPSGEGSAPAMKAAIEFWNARPQTANRA